MIKTAIIGLGHIGKIHIKSLILNSDFQIVAICDKDKAFKNKYKKIKFYESHINMLVEGGFDKVLVATPNNTHKSISIDVLLYGYDLILEKPAATNLDEFKELERLKKVYQKKIYYLFHAAFGHEVLFFKEFYEQNKEQIGELNSFKCQFYDPYFIDNNLEAHAIGLENPWIDSGVNALSVLFKFIPLKNISTIDIKSTNFFDQEISHLRYFEIKNGHFGIIDTAWDQSKNFKKSELYFKNGFRLILNHSEQSLNLFDLDKKSEILCKKFKGDRLLNHYKNSFKDYVTNQLKSNKIISNEIHNKLFESI